MALLLLSGAASAGAAAVSAGDVGHVLAAELGEPASSVTDCQIQYTNAEVLPPNSSYFAYNPTMVVKQDEGRVLGISRVQMVLDDDYRCQGGDSSAMSVSDQLNAAADIMVCRWVEGMDHSRDMLVEWEASLSSPCEARFTRVVGEGEDPRLFHAASGATLATFEHFQAWTVDGMALHNSLALRPLLMYAWGSELENGAMPASSRLITSGAHASSSKFLVRAMTKNVSVFGVDRLAMWGELQGLLTSCDAFEDVAHAKCAHNGGYTQRSYANFTRAPVACDIDYKAAMKTHEAKLEKQARKRRRRAKHAVNLGAFTNGVGFFSDKNWSPFAHEGTDYMVTWLEPFTTCAFEGNVQDTFKIDTLGGSNATFAMFHAGANEVNTADQYISRPVATMGCGHCQEVSSVSNKDLIGKMLDNAMDSSVELLVNQLGMPRPNKVQPKGGEDGVHLNGVPFVKVQNFRGRSEAFLGVAHIITEAAWFRNWTQAMEDSLYAVKEEVKSMGLAYLEGAKALSLGGGDMEAYRLPDHPEYDGSAVVSNYSAGSALLYQHYYTLSSATPPFQLLDIASKPLPFKVEGSPQPWFDTCNDLKESVDWWHKWNETHDNYCGLSIAFASGFERVDDNLMVAYGVGDSKSHLLSMPVTEAETFFSA